MALFALCEAKFHSALQVDAASATVDIADQFPFNVLVDTANQGLQISILRVNFELHFKLAENPPWGSQFPPVPSFATAFISRSLSDGASSSSSTAQSPGGQQETTVVELTQQDAQQMSRRRRNVCQECERKFVTPSKVILALLRSDVTDPVSFAFYCTIRYIF